MHRIFDHIDLRVASVRASRAFYDALLPAVGFGETDVDDTGLLVYFRRVNGRVQEAFTLIDDPLIKRQIDDVDTIYLEKTEDHNSGRLRSK